MFEVPVVLVFPALYPIAVLFAHAPWQLTNALSPTPVLPFPVVGALLLPNMQLYPTHRLLIPVETFNWALLPKPSSCPAPVKFRKALVPTAVSFDWPTIALHELAPMQVLVAPVVRATPAGAPTKVLKPPVVIANPA
jgi:hypothetical protein